MVAQVNSSLGVLERGNPCHIRFLSWTTDRATRDILATVLQNAGFAVKEAADNASALELLNRCSISLVTTDVNHGYASGIELIREIRNSPIGKTVPIVVITGNADRKTELSAWHAAMSAFISKPFSLEELLLATERLLGQTNALDTRLLTLGVEGRDLDY